MEEQKGLIGGLYVSANVSAVNDRAAAAEETLLCHAGHASTWSALKPS